MADQILVYADWAALQSPVRMGTLQVDRVRGRENYAFIYDPEWLKRTGEQALDPSLLLFGGPQYPPQGRTGFGLFMDSSPDRWGRMLMQRREAQQARTEQRTARALFETDYLLGVSDDSRMGALRFARDPDAPFLALSTPSGIPPMARLRQLEQAARTMEDEDAPIDEQDEMLALLLAPGSSLGGARPKASVLDADGSLWIAKFPSRSDAYDKGAWEAVTHQLAKRCGINVVPARAERFSQKGHTFLTRRFDRDAKGKRIHFASAMTMLGRMDGDNASTGASYLEMAEFLMRHGARTQEDLEQLWKRIVFNICVSNTDDHLRNHGFLLAANGWILSPAYDLNPEPQGRGLSLNIDEHDNTLSLALAVDIAGHFRVDKVMAERDAKRISMIVERNWRALASEQSLSSGAIERMEPAFRKKP